MFSTYPSGTWHSRIEFPSKETKTLFPVSDVTRESRSEGVKTESTSVYGPTLPSLAPTVRHVSLYPTVVHHFHVVRSGPETKPRRGIEVARGPSVARVTPKSTRVSPTTHLMSRAINERCLSLYDCLDLVRPEASKRRDTCHVDSQVTCSLSTYHSHLPLVSFTLPERPVKWFWDLFGPLYRVKISSYTIM